MANGNGCFSSRLNFEYCWVKPAFLRWEACPSLFRVGWDGQHSPTPHRILMYILASHRSTPSFFGGGHDVHVYQRFPPLSWLQQALAYSVVTPGVYCAHFGSGLLTCPFFLRVAKRLVFQWLALSSFFCVGGLCPPAP